MRIWFSMPPIRHYYFSTKVIINNDTYKRRGGKRTSKRAHSEAPALREGPLWDNNDATAERWHGRTWRAGMSRAMTIRAVAGATA